jgi:quinoprotein glucose dehydrogenase
VHGPPEGTRYSPLRQITPDNVPTLQVAWTYQTGDADPAAFSTIECTPLVVEGAMYVTSPRNKVIALDAATGTERWRFDPFAERPWRSLAAGGVNRGVAFWSDGKPGGERALLHGTPDGRLIALDPETGRPKSGFGENGTVDLKAGLEAEVRDRGYGMTSPPAVFEDLVIIGASVGEGPEPAAPGDIRAFDVRTGRERWTFHTVPRPGEAGHETWVGDSWKHRGGVNAWSGLTVDPGRGLVFAGLGSATFDFYGGDRHGDNLYANSTVALDARTGQRVWHFQTVRHDLWDYDLPTPPVLVTVSHGGRSRDAAAQVTKTGVVFLFDRQTGVPLFDVIDHEAPRSDVPGEQPAASQPMPVRPPPFARHRLSLEDVHGTDEEAAADARARYAQLKGGRIFSPPSFEGTLSFPGFRGGATWAGASFDPAKGWLFVNSNEIANVITLTPTEPGTGSRYRMKKYEQFLDKHGYPATRPPWGTLSAIDLNAGLIVWQVPLGEHPELAARGLRNTGTENFGGSIVTATGLVFIGGSKDEKLHAFDAATGKLLWEAALPAGGYATPATYAVNGRQFVVIAAGGGGKPRTKSGDAFVAFALPADSLTIPTR